MASSIQKVNDQVERRKRLHELLIALIQKQDGIELVEDEAPNLEGKMVSGPFVDAANWLDRNKRILKNYQNLVRSAITLDALLDSETQLK
tara:strand:- start:425 stop:694 length:270 start_codon:yes stop_codon:yes gene_type:complete